MDRLNKDIGFNFCHFMPHIFSNILLKLNSFLDLENEFSVFLYLMVLYIFVFSKLDYDFTAQGQHASVISMYESLVLLSL